MRLIPEWNNHTNCLIAWPCNQDLYGNRLHQARIEIANLANQISEEEEVYIYCNKIDYKKCSKMISNKNISIFETNLDDSWMRDIAPIFFRDGIKLSAANFNFNGYGKYPNFKNDNQISKYICDQFNIKSIEVDLTLEGGGITYDDNGNLFTTESVLLNPNRKNYSKNYIDQTLTEIFDLEQFFLSQNINAEIIQIPLPSEIMIENKRLVASYLNFYFSKKSIIIPKFNVKEDEEIYDIFKSLFSDKNIKMIETKNINYGGGNIHCVTMNVPKI